MRRFIIDCDTAEDDIFSFFLLLHEGVNVEGIPSLRETYPSLLR
jgi:hypothetical protein